MTDLVHRSRALLGPVVAAWIGAGFAACDRDEAPAPEWCTDADKLSIYTERIQPLLVDGRKSSCNECHLAGVDLGLYSKNDDECATMACMVESGIVDLDEPDDSVVLQWILRGTPDSELITTEVLQAEHDGMLEWIQYHSECGSAACPDIDNPCGAGPTAGKCEVPPSAHDLPPRGFDDPGDCSDLTLERAFGELVYPWRGRCYPCHFSSFEGTPEDAPRWIVDGDCNIGALASMRKVVELGLVDLEDPEQSLFLLKPLAESIGGVEHDGGDKFETFDDGAYQDFAQWIELYVACRPPSE